MKLTTLLPLIVLIFSFVLMALLQSNKKKKEEELVTPIKLLPYPIKYLAWILIAFAFLISFSIIPGLRAPHPFHELFLAVGLFLFVISKEKIEDEMLMALRLKAFFVSTTTNFLAFLIWISINNIGSTESYVPTVYMFMSVWLFLYLIYFQSVKRKLNNEE